MGDVEYTIDDETLRDRPVDEPAAWNRLRELEDQGSDGDAERVPLLRMLGQLDEAERVGWEALARLGGPSKRSEVDEVGLGSDMIASAIRLAHVLHWQEKYETAEPLFLQALGATQVLMSSDPARATRLEAFTHQHLGKMRFDQDLLDAALDHFNRALFLRLNLEAPEDQVSSSLQAIAATERRLGRPGTLPEQSFE